MTFDQIIHSLALFRTELTLCATIIGVLLVRTFVPRWKTAAFPVTLAGLLAATYLAVPWSWFSHGVPAVGTPIFTGTLISDSFTVVLRVVLMLFAILFVAFTQIAAEDRDDMTEFYVLMLGALLGMCLMISANHVLIVLLGVEMASVPCYVLAGIRRTARQAAKRH